MARNLGKRPIALGADIQLREDGKAPTEIRILRAGLNETDRGYPILFDDIAAAMVMDAFRVDGKPRLYADWNHGMLPDDSGAAPSRDAGASSCSFVPEVRNGELLATDIDWTADGRADVESKKYNLFSPAFPQWTDEAGNVRPKKLINFALVNLAGLRNIEPLLAAMADVTAPNKETSMTAEEIARLTARNAELETENKTLRLAATEVASLTGVLALSASAGSGERTETVRGLVTLRAEVLRLTAETTNEGAVAALRSLKEQAGKATALEAQIETDKATALRAELDSVWALASKEGKLPPGEIKEEEESLTQFTGGKITRAVVDAAKRRVEKLGARIVRAGDGERGNGSDVIALTAAEKDLAKRTNVSEAAMLKAKQNIADQNAKKRSEGRAS